MIFKVEQMKILKIILKVLTNENNKNDFKSFNK
jgi:hypothetical protein